MILKESPYSLLQQITLALIRFLAGWHLFYQGLGKLREPDWSAQGYLASGSGWFGELFQQIAGWPAALNLADFLVVWGLLLTGFLLMIGLFSRSAAAVGFTLVFLFFLAAPPLPVMGFTVPGPEGFEFLVNKTLIEALLLLVIAVFPTGQVTGLDILISNWREKRRSIFSP
jgi:thiosulfate dehydrogenase [quinone] large subunit